MEKVERFSYLVSNPPYQDEKNSAIFQHFQNLSDKISEKSCLIYPADKWTTRSGKGVGLDQFSKEQLNDSHVKNVTIYEEANSIFESIHLHGGVSMVTKDSTSDNNGKIEVTTIDKEKNSDTQNFPHFKNRVLSTSNTVNKIVEKVLEKVSEEDNTPVFLDSIVQPTSIYGISSSFIMKSKSAVPKSVFEEKLANGEIENPDSYIKVLSNEVTGKGGRVKWFHVKRDEIPKFPTIHGNYIIAISNRNAGGYGGRSQQARIFGPDEVFGDSRFAVAVFYERQHAANFMKWMGTDVVRFLILSSSRRVKNFGVNVPVLSNYSNSNPHIDFSETSETLNQQLVSLYGLSDEDVDCIRKTVKTLGTFEMSEDS